MTTVTEPTTNAELDSAPAADRPMLVRVTATQRLTPNLNRITFTGPDLDRFGYHGPDQLARVFLAPRPGTVPRLPAHADKWWTAVRAMPAEHQPHVRNYTVRRLDPVRRELVIDFVLHGDEGPASSWAGRAAPGDVIGVLSDGADYAPPAGTRWQLLVGDDTAVPAIAAIIESLPADQPAIALLEVAGAADELPIAVPPRVELTWLHRAGTPAGYSDIVLRTLRRTALPDGPPYAFVAGESGMVTSVRRHLVRTRGLAKDTIYFCGYWRAAA